MGCTCGVETVEYDTSAQKEARRRREGDSSEVRVDFAARGAVQFGADTSRGAVGTVGSAAQRRHACPGCSQPVRPGEGVQAAAGWTYHAACMRCSACGASEPRPALRGGVLVCAGCSGASLPPVPPSTSTDDVSIGVVGAPRVQAGLMAAMKAEGMTPHCPGCGGSLDGGDVVVAGAARFHRGCYKGTLEG